MSDNTHETRRTAVAVLERVERDEAYSHIELAHELDRRQLEDRDRRLATRIVYGTLAMQRAIDARLSAALEAPVEQRTRRFERACMRSAIYQMYWLDRVPTRAAVHVAVELVRRKRGKRAAGFVNAILRRVADERDPLPEPDDPVAAFGLEHSLPDEVVRRAFERFGTEEAEEWARALNAAPPLTVRVNGSAAKTPEALAEFAQRVGGTPTARAPWGVSLETSTPALDAALDAAECRVQDEGSQLVVHWLGELPAGRIWDACAGQGGKTLQLLDLLRREGLSARVVSTDTHIEKIERLRSAVREWHGEEAWARAGVLPRGEVLDLGEGLVLETGVVDARTPPYMDPFDVVLVDAPCSGLGLMRRHPETRWRRDVSSIEALAELQAAILDGVVPMLDGGATLLYAVCTNTIAETQRQSESLLQRHPTLASAAPGDAALVEGVDGGDGVMELTPHEHGTDGFYAARFRVADEGEAA